jgi:hypothetical protein
MFVSRILLCIIASMSALATSPASAPANKPSPPSHDKSPISDRPVAVSHRTIYSQRSFEATRAALESAIPPLNTTAIRLLGQGDTAGARDALEALPALSSFIVPPRNFGQLITIWGNTGENALQYEIGNPYTASKFARFQLGASVSRPPLPYTLPFLWGYGRAARAEN